MPRDNPLSPDSSPITDTDLLAPSLPICISVLTMTPWQLNHGVPGNYPQPVCPPCPVSISVGPCKNRALWQPQVPKEMRGTGSREERPGKIYSQLWKPLSC